MQEVLSHFWPKIERSSVLDKLGLEQDRFFLISAHREENVDSWPKLKALLDCLNGLASVFCFPIIVSTHPRTRQRLERHEVASLSPLVRFMPPFSFTDYVKLQVGAHCVVSDSGTITEEASLLDLPAVMIRDAHERPEGIDAGTLVMSGFATGGLVDAIRIVRESYSGTRRFSGAVPDYQGDEVSAKVVRIVFSYIDFVNRVVWSKSECATLPNGTATGSDQSTRTDENSRVGSESDDLPLPR